ncbi:MULTISPECIES: hypothetical protein [Helicobacter]|uniref:hypothetical protein n=1 Tax=Helicobacter TaxID=209 RepID=UPI0013CDEB9E|nr:MULTISPECIES: hypothetical protein [Helicobacter]
MALDLGYQFYLSHIKPPPPPHPPKGVLDSLTSPAQPRPPEKLTHNPPEFKDFDYPILERQITLEFREHKQAQKLFVRNLDSYKFFCLHEILKEKRIDFATDKKGRTTTLIIYLPNSPLRQAFLDDLRYYQIPYQLN